MKYIFIFHANLNYAYLPPEKYEFVIRSSYELIIDTIRDHFPDTKYVFEASGYTVEQIAEKTPDVLEKLKQAIQSGQCEFMGSPYAHPMLPNFPKEDGLWTIKFSDEVYQKYLGIHPRSFWNPECGWCSYIPSQIIETGYTNTLVDFEAYSCSHGPDGKPIRPEIYEVECPDAGPVFYKFDFNYELPGTEKTLHFPFKNIMGVPDGKLRAFMRSDRVAQYAVRYFMGMEGYTFDGYMDLIRKYSRQPDGEPEGALIVFADDAEYIGTNAWFRLKFQDEPDHVFEAAPETKEKLIKVIDQCLKWGEFVTLDYACNELPALSDLLAVDDDTAWHWAKPSTWAGTPMARQLRPWQDLVREKLNAVSGEMSEEMVRAAWYHLTNSYNSDGQWPPTLPDEPHIVYPYNYGYCFENLLQAEQLVGGVDRGKLDTDAVATTKAILTPQQDLILKKAEKMMESSDREEVRKGRLACGLIEKSRNVKSIQESGAKLLYPAEYKVRADALVKARRLVGGVIA